MAGCWRRFPFDFFGVLLVAWLLCFAPCPTKKPANGGLWGHRSFNTPLAEASVEPYARNEDEEQRSRVIVLAGGLEALLDGADARSLTPMCDMVSTRKSLYGLVSIFSGTATHGLMHRRQSRSSA